MNRIKRAISFEQLMNDITFRNLYNRYKLLALNVFKWEGLPPTIKEEHIEEPLFLYGKAIVFQDPALAYPNCLPAEDGKGLDIHGKPIRYWATGYGYREEYDRDECAMIFNNKLELPTQPILVMYVREIVDVMRTTSVNVKTMKMPFIVTGNKDSIQSLKAIMKEIQQNEFAIAIDDSISLKDGIQVLQTGAKFYGKDMLEYRQMLENELLTFLGVNTVPIRKAERLVTAEAESNLEYVTDNVQIMLESRERAAKRMNELFGLNVRVSLRNAIKEDGEGKKEGKENVALS